MRSDGRRAGPVRLEAVARDLVDAHGVEVVDGRVAVAVEGVAPTAGSAAAICASAAWTRSSSVAPQNACQAAAAVLEVRVHEPLGDRAARELDDREGRPRAAAGVRRRRVGEAEQLADIEAPRVRHRPVGGAGEKGRGRVLLPDQFEHDLAV